MPGSTAVADRLLPGTTPEIERKFADTVRYCASKVAPFFTEHLEQADLEQEGWIWAQTNLRTIERLLGDNFKHSKRMVAELCAVMEKAGNRASVVASGYQEFDAYWYSAATIEMVLTDFFMTKSYGSGTREERMPTVDPSHGNNYPVIVADVLAAWKRANLEHDLKRILIFRYGCCMTHNLIADAMGISETTVARRIREGLMRISDQLNETADILRRGGCAFAAPERTEFPEE